VPSTSRALYIFYESALGLTLFEVEGFEEIQQNSDEFQNSVLDFKKISKVITLKSFSQFKTSKQALDNITGITHRVVTEDVAEFLKLNLPTKKKSSSKSFSVAFVDVKYGKLISEELNIQIHVGDFVQEIFRAIRVHYHKFLSVKEEDILRAQLGLGHSYSRMKCMFDVNRQDKPVINAIALIDQLDKNINSFCMRIKEWFAWHYPELNRLVADNATYVKIVNHIQTRKNLMENKDDLMQGLEEICVEPELAKQIYDSACMSSGQDLNEIDLINIKFFCDKVKNLIHTR
jgi:nucleolar protein 56